jgi:hypothetical protein
MKRFWAFLIGIYINTIVWGVSVTVTVETAGTLQEKISALDEGTITGLTIIGPLNASDLRYLCDAAGDEGNFQTTNLRKLDLRDVTLVFTDERYSSSGYGNGAIYYYLSDSCYIEGKSREYLGMVITWTNYHCNDLGGLCSKMTNLEYIAFPKTMKGIGENCLSGSNVSTVVFPEQMEYVKFNAFGDTPWYNEYLSEQPNGIVYFQDIAYDYKGDIPANNTITFKDGTKGIIGHYGIDGIKYVNIPSSVKYIGDWCFSNLNHSYCEINMEEGLESIGDGAFANCNIPSINIPNSVNKIGQYTFFGCSLNAIHMPKSISWIESSTFSGAVIDSVFIDDLRLWCNIDIRHAEDGNPLYHAKKLFVNGILVKELVIPHGTKRINKRVFYGCNAITSVSIPSTVEEFGDEVFYGCDSLRTAVINSPFIGKNAFFGCDSLSKVEIRSTEVGDYAFDGCGNLKELYIDCINIGDGAFSGCEKLRDITFNNVNNIGSKAFFECSSLETVSLDNVNSIGDYAFSGCSSLETVSLDNVNSIGDYAFSKCKLLKNVFSLDEVKEIGEWAFSRCAIEGVLNLNADIIGSYAFCGNLISEVHLDCVTSCGGHVFDDNELLKKAELGPRVKSFWGFSLKIEKVVIYCASTPMGVNADTVVIMGNNKEIADGWEIDADNLIIEEGVETLNSINPVSEPYFDKNNFCGVRSITIPSSLKNFLGHIGNYYYENSNLKEIHIKDIRSWCEMTFDNTYVSWHHPLYYRYDQEGYSGVNLYLNDELLQDVVIPEGTTYVKNKAFFYSLITSVSIPSTVTQIGKYAFAKSTVLEKVYMKDSLKAIEECAFQGCTNLKSIDFPETLLSIDKDAFGGCNSLDSICLPASLKKLGRQAFGYCHNLKKVRSKITTPSDISTDVFDDECYYSATLYVPAGTGQIYKEKVGWNLFHNIVEMLDEASIEIEPIQEDKEVSFKDGITEETDLSNKVIDNTYFNMNSENGDGYDSDEQALVLNSTTTEEQMDAIQEAEVGDDEIQENYNGIIFELAAGSGIITIDVKTVGAHVLNVQIGKGELTKITKTERGTVDVPFNVTEPTYVYLYASTAGGSAARLDRAPSAAANSVLLYGYKVNIGATSIEELKNSKVEGLKYYDLNGRQVKTPGKGVYIINGRKVLVK